MAETSTVTDNLLRSLLDVQIQLFDQLQTRTSRARKALLGLLEAVAPGEMDNLIKGNPPVENLPIDDLVELTTRFVKTQMVTAQQELQRHDQDTGHNHLLEENSRLALEVERQRSALLRARDLQEELEKRIRLLQNEVTALQQVTAKNQHKDRKSEVQKHETIPNLEIQVVEPGNAEALEKWQQKGTSKRDTEVLRILGETGLSRRPEIETRIGQLFGIDEDSGSIRACLARMQDAELIVFDRPWKENGTGAGGRYPDLIRLTEKGQQLCLQLFGKNPVENEFDRLKKIHVSPEHTLLNMQVIDFLKGTDYQVIDIAPEIHLEADRLFCPDLVLQGTDQKTIYVEVEREISKSSDRKAKWENFCLAGGGHLYVICDNRTAMHNVRGEIVFSLAVIRDLDLDDEFSGSPQWQAGRVREYLDRLPSPLSHSYVICHFGTNRSGWHEPGGTNRVAY